MMSRFTNLFHKARPGSFVLLMLLGLALASCRLQPKGTTVFKFTGKSECTGAQLFAPPDEIPRPPVRLRYADTNTFQTTATLTPGKYILAVRIGEGTHRSREITIEPNKDYYEIPEIMTYTNQVSQGPAVSGTVEVTEGKPPSQVAILFINHSVVVRQAPVANGRFNTNAPNTGSYRIEVIALGQPPRCWIGNNVDVPASKDLGVVTLH